MQVPRNDLAWACGERSPVLADGSVLSSLWICAPGSCCLRIYGMAAKAVPADMARDSAAAQEAVDRQRALYETQWQAHGPHARLRTGGLAQQRLPALHVSQPGVAAAARYALPATAGCGWTAGSALAANAAQMAVLQLGAPSAGSTVLLQTHGGQPVCSTPGQQSSLTNSAAALGLHSMLRVADAEAGGAQFASVDIAAHEPQPGVARWVP